MEQRLFSVVVVAAMLLVGGCATEHYLTDARHPEVAIMADGGVTYRGEFVDPEDLPDLLERSGLTKEDTINIRCPATMRDMRMPRRVMGILLKGGYPRHVLVGERQAYSEVGRTAEERRRDRIRQERERKKGARAPSTKPSF